MSRSPEPSDDDHTGGDPESASGSGRSGIADDTSRLEGTDADATDTDADDAAESDAKPAKPSLTRTLVEWAVVIVAALLIAFGIKTFLFQPFKIPSGSMEQTLKIGDRVLVNKLSYHFHSVHHGDVVVFRRPPNHPEIDAADLIKRVIGLPGDRLSIHDDHVYVNGKMLTEPYVKRLPGSGQPEPTEPRPPGCTFPYFTGVTEPPGLAPDTIVVPKGDVFVMGDNRTDSSDSRCFGPISEKLIVGRAFLRMWPPSRIGFL